MARDLSALEDTEDDDLLVDEEEGQEEEQPKPKQKEEGKEEEAEIEVLPDARYEKKAWKDDPANVGKEEEDPDLVRSRKAIKRIGKLTAANNELARQRDMERDEKDQLLNAYRSLEARAKKVEDLLEKGSVTALEKGVESEKHRIALATKEYKDALVAGDADAATLAAAKLAEANTAAARLSSEAESRKVAKPAEQQRQAPIQQPAPQVSQAQIEWQRKNAWFDEQGGDELSDLAIRTHWRLVEKAKKGEVVIGSQQYFKAIDKVLRDKHPEQFGLAKATQNDATPPPSGRAPNSQQAKVAGSNKITFTQSQLATAKLLGINTDSNTAEGKRELTAYWKQIQRTGE